VTRPTVECTTISPKPLTTTPILCPAFVSGTEPWNTAPYDQKIAAWTAEMIPQIQRDIDIANQPVNRATSPKI